ncbi:hypothetical protein [Selenomonas sp. AE3005]|uniref:hypothetical protein n=1 Tax=Selenomonas sp. AE3005 TaxID=1485543 RepID=UPI00048692D1|nr:hypothetical protein [Selenomonas sp. AE3005]
MKYIKYAMVLLAFVYWLVPVYLRAFPGWLNSGIYNSIPLFYLLCNFRRVQCLLNGIKKKYLWISFSFWVVALIWSLCAIVYNNTDDYSYFMKIFTAFRWMYISMFLLLLAENTLRNKSILEIFSIFYSGAIAVCVFFTVLTLLFPDMRENYILLLNKTDRPSLLEDEMYITRFSVGGFAGFNQTILASIAGILSYYLISRKIYIGFPLLLVSLLGNLFYGRIGIILSLVAIVVLMMKTLKFNTIAWQVGGIVIAFFFLYVVLGFFDNPMFDAWKLWLMQPIEGFIQGLQYGQITFGSSGDKLVYGMYFMPDDSTILLGDGRYENVDGSYYMNTDAGYMRIILYFGVIGAFLIYGSYLALTAFALHNLRGNKVCRYLIMALVICFFVAEYKGDAYPIFFGIVMVLGLCGNGREVSVCRR